MTYVDPINLIDTISKKYPGLEVSCSGDPNVYSNINWGILTPITESQLVDDKLLVFRGLVNDKIRDEARLQRFKKMLIVLGTDDQEQIRTYEEKFVEAQAWVADNAALTPIMTGEVSYTGETIAVLAPRVISEFTYAKAVLQSMYGNIEGQRRAQLTLIGAMTLNQLEAYIGPVWN